MTIPNVTMAWCTKKSTCRWCGQTIPQATPMVTVFFWNKGKEDRRSWNVKRFYHPQCWIDQGLDYLDHNPFVSKQKERCGRKAMLCDEDRRKRLLLVKRFHAVYQRKCNNSLSYPDKLVVDANLTQQMVDIMLEVATLGGVPKGWAGKLG